MDEYGGHDRERWWPETHSTRRSDFARDRARLLHSSSLRRLAQKTQVVSPTAGLDFARNRLTHSLEVAQVGRELATALGLDPDVVDTACLAHDIGHPPFGHNGERALNAWATDVGGFEGNAQTLRVLTRLEPKIVADRSYGLNLTRASTDAACKYPWAAQQEVLDPSGRVKFGFYQDDVDAFAWVRAGAPEGRPCIEAEVMDLADDIAYSVHDFEDAMVNGFIDPRELASRVDHASLVARMQRWVGDVSSDDLVAAFDRLDDLDTWVDAFDGTRRDQARLKNLTSRLIGRFANAAAAATRDAYSGPLARFGGRVVVPADVRAEIAVLKGTVAAYVMDVEQRQPLYEHQRRVVTELADRLLALGEGALEATFAADWRAAEDDAARKRVVIDQVANLSDQTALAWHAQQVI